jgi:hypothetical protein
MCDCSKEVCDECRDTFRKEAVEILQRIKRQETTVTAELLRLEEERAATFMDTGRRVTNKHAEALRRLSDQ